MVMVLIHARCNGCRSEADYVVSREQYSVKCNNDKCPQYVSISPRDGMAIDGLCTHCHNPLDAAGHIWEGGHFARCDRTPKEKK